MNKLLRHFTIILMFMLPLNARQHKTTDSFTPKYHIETYFRNNNINIKTKTYKGWIRVLLSEEKRKKYHLHLSKKEMELYVNELKLLHNSKIEGKL